MIKISAIIITLNEERNIGRCLQSLKDVADEIVVVDSFSKDKTEEICKSYGAKFIQHKFEGYIEQKNFALKQESNDFVLSLDADEALSDTLRQSILQLKNNNAVAGLDGYKMNRLTNYCGKWIRHGSWYPDRKLRLFNRNKGTWGGDNPHDKFIPDENAKTGFLKGDILHYSFYSVEEHKKQARKFAEISARSLYARGRRSTVFHILFRPLFKIVRDYIFKLGFLDGYYGLVICAITVKATYIKYSVLRGLEKASPPAPLQRRGESTN